MKNLCTCKKKEYVSRANSRLLWGTSLRKLGKLFFRSETKTASLKSQMDKNMPNSRPFFQGAQILGSHDFGPRIYTQFQVKRIHFPWATHTVNPLLSPPSLK